MKGTYTRAEIAKIEKAMCCCPDYSDIETFGLILDAAWSLCGMDRARCRRRLKEVLARLAVRP